MQEESDVDEEPGFLVRVTGLSSKTTKDALLNFFENTRRSKGGEIKDVQLNQDEGFADIIFWSNQDAETVAQNDNLELDGAKLTTALKKLPKELPVDPRRLHVAGINDRTTNDGLKSFMVVVSDGEVESMLFGSNSDCMVSFKEAIDFHEVQKMCKKNSLDDNFLRVEEVRVCECIEVSGLASKTTRDAIFYYFRNKRNGGGDVKSYDDIDIAKRRMYVSFEDHKVIDSIMKQDHVVDGRRHYYPFLGETSLTNPAGAEKCNVVTRVDPQSMLFIKEFFSPEFDQLLQERRVKCTWHQDSGEIVLGCTEPDIDTKTWKNSCEAVVAYINQIVTEKITISREIWELISDELTEKSAVFESQISIQHVFDFRKKENSIVLRGKETDVISLTKQLQGLVSQAEEQIMIEKSKISKKIEPVSDVQMELLRFSGFVDGLNTRYEGLEVAVIRDSSSQVIQLRGLEEEVNECTAFVWQTLSRVKENEMKFSNSVVSILSCERGKKFITTRFKNNSIEAVISFDSTSDSHLMVTATDRDHMNKAVDFIKNAIAEVSIPLDTDQKQLVESEKWKDLKLSLHQSTLLQVTEELETSMLSLIGIKEEVDIAKEKVKEFYDNNVILNQAIHTEPGRVRFLLEFRLLDIKNVEDSLKKHSVRVLTESGESEGKIVVSGTKEGIKQALPRTEMLLKSVKYSILVIETQGSSKIDNGKERLQCLRGVERKYGCVIEQCNESKREDEKSNIGFYPKGRTSTNVKIHIFADNNTTAKKVEEELKITLKDDSNEVPKRTQNESMKSAIAPRPEIQFIEKTNYLQETKDISEQTEECASVLVSGLFSKTTKDAIQMYFENPRRSHGGDVQNVELNDNQAVVTFDSPSVAEKVLEWGKHSLDGCPLTVTRPVQPRKTPTSNKEEESEPVKRSRVVRVMGISEKTTKDALLIFFECTRRSGGGEIEDIQHVPEEKLADITFCSHDDAERVSQKGDIWLDGSNLTVTLKEIPEEIPKDPYKLHVIGMAEKTTKAGLESFLEVVSGEEVESIFFGSNTNAMVTFKEPPDIDKVQKKCSTRKLDGSHLKIGQVNICDCIEVIGLAPSTTKDTVFYYFDNPMNGGGEVKNVETDSGSTRALVYFVDPSVVISVMRKGHKINGAKLEVVPYYPFLGDASGTSKRQKKKERKRKGPTMLSEKTTTEEKDVCPICLDGFHNPVTLAKCKHRLCMQCIDQAFQHHKVCPTCGMAYGVQTGNMPPGTMNHNFDRYLHLPGYERYGTIRIDYHFPSGMQGPEHPYPGQSYSGTARTAYLPDCAEGREVLDLLKKAFNARLTFTIGRSVTTGATNVVTWNDISHKTNPYGGATGFGYPDPGYLKRVKDELAAKGIS